MKRYIFATTALVTGFMSSPNDAYAANVDPFAKYGDRLIFDVFRKGEKVGEHTVEFRRDGTDIIAESEFNVRVTFLGFTAYSYDYTSTERWRGGRLIELTSYVNDDGEELNVDVARIGNSLQVTGPEGKDLAPMGLYPTTHWNVGVLGSNQIINTITGDVGDVAIVERAIEDVPTGIGPRTARHYQYQGDLKTHVWYDDEGRWVKMRFNAKDGSEIRYVCVSCNAPTGAQTATTGLTGGGS